MVAFSLVHGIAFFVFVLTITSGSTIARHRDIKTATASNTCNGRICPAYSVLNRLSADIEEREYDFPALPSFTSTQCLPLSAAKAQGYFHLHMYTMAAQNLEKKRLQMGVPVLMEVKHVDDVEPRCAHVYTTLFYVTDALPTPINTNITTKEIAGRRFYVYSFGGYNTKPEDSALELRIRLNSRKLCYDPSIYYVATYQSPREEINRVNEIWMPSRSCSS